MSVGGPAAAGGGDAVSDAAIAAGPAIKVQAGFRQHPSKGYTDSGTSLTRDGGRRRLGGAPAVSTADPAAGSGLTIEAVAERYLNGGGVGPAAVNAAAGSVPIVKILPP